jgi:hypothetical protein
MQLLNRLGKDRNAQLLIDHKGKDSHLGGAALGELDGPLPELGLLLVEGIPAKVDVVVTEVTNEFSSGDVLHDSNLQEGDEGDDLANASLGDGGQAGNPLGMDAKVVPE